MVKLSVIRDELVNRITALGFNSVEVDTEGMVSGKMNRVIGKKSEVENLNI